MTIPEHFSCCAHPDDEVLRRGGTIALHAGSGDQVWLIDPIDGTSSWYRGFIGFVCQAAYFHDSKPVFGVISAPALDTVWYGMEGLGSFMNGCKLPLSSSSRRIFIDNTPNPHGITARLYLYLNATGYLESGSMGLKLCLWQTVLLIYLLRMLL